VRRWDLLAVDTALTLAAACAAFWASRSKDRTSGRLSVLVLSSIGIAFTSVIMGPFIVVPSMAAVNTLAFVVLGQKSDRLRAIVIGSLAVVVPFVLGMIGVLPRPYSFGPEGMLVNPALFHFPEVPTLAFLLLFNLLLVVAPAVILARVRDNLRAAEERSFMHAWTLRKLVPEVAAKAPPAGPVEAGCEHDACAPFAEVMGRLTGKAPPAAS